jgi:DNA repair protein RecO (recombination protein O)
MSSSNTESTAIVLDSLNHGESDKIVTFFCQGSGRVTGIAKGANRSKKRFQNKLEIFSYITISFKERQNTSLVFIEDAELHDSFINLRCYMERYISASFIRETLLLATSEREGDKEVFALLHWALRSIDEAKPHLPVCIIFLLRLFNHLGYRPDFDGCRSCSSSFSLRDRYFFHHVAGGLICSNCAETVTGNYTELSPGTIRILKQSLDETPDRLHRLGFSKQATSQSLTMLHHYGRNLFQREIHSWKALRGLMR